MLSVFAVYVITLDLNVFMRSLLYEDQSQKDNCALWRVEEVPVVEINLNIFT